MPGECQILYLKITMRSVMMLFFCLATCFSTFFCSVHGMGLIGFATLKRLEEKKTLMDKIVSLFMNVLIWGEELTEWFIPRYLIFCYILDARKRRTQCKGFPAEDYYFLNFIQLKKNSKCDRTSILSSLSCFLQNHPSRSTTDLKQKAVGD